MQSLKKTQKPRQNPNRKIEHLLITDALNGEQFSFMRVYYLIFCRDKFIEPNFEKPITFFLARDSLI